MRITNMMTSQKMYNDITKNRMRVDKYYSQMSTGKAIMYPSDDPIRASRALKFRTNVSQAEQYKRNVAQGYSWMEISELAIANVEELTERIRSLAAQGANDSYDDDDRAAIATEVQSLIEELGMQMNQTYGGRNVFTGYRTDVPAVFTNSSSNVYEIKQDFSYLDIESFRAYSKTALDDVANIVDGYRVLLPYNHIKTESIDFMQTVNFSISSADAVPSAVTLVPGTFDEYEVTFKDPVDAGKFSVSDKINIGGYDYEITGINNNADGTAISSVRITAPADTKLGAGGSISYDYLMTATSITGVTPSGTNEYKLDINPVASGSLNVGDIVNIDGKDYEIKASDATSITIASDTDPGISSGSDIKVKTTDSPVIGTSELTAEGEYTITLTPPAAALSAGSTINIGGTDYIVEEITPDGVSVKVKSAMPSPSEADLDFSAADKVAYLPDLKGFMISSDYNFTDTITIAGKQYALEKYTEADFPSAPYDQTKVYYDETNGIYYFPDALTENYKNATSIPIAVSINEYLAASFVPPAGDPNAKAPQINVRMLDKDGEKDANNNPLENDDILSSDPTAYKPGAWDVHYISNTGELILSNEVKEYLTSLGRSGFSVDYEKGNFEKGEINPLVYFDCVNKTENSLDKGKVYDMQNQSLEYEFSTNIRIGVNNLAKDIFTAGMYSELKEFCTFLNNAKVSNRTDLELRYSSDPFNLQGEALTKKVDEHISEETKKSREALQQRFEALLGNIDGFASTISKQRADLGTRMSRLELLGNRLGDDVLSYTKLLSENEDADLMEAAMNWKTGDAIYQASLSVSAKLLQTSLVDFLR